MAFGGGGFAISHALAMRLARMQDGCMHRYPAMYGSDDHIHACMSELGVLLNQCDIWGDVLGLLGSHPVVPLVTLHHFDFLPDGGRRRCEGYSRGPCDWTLRPWLSSPCATTGISSGRCRCRGG
jgi:hypothetical protein